MSTNRVKQSALESALALFPAKPHEHVCVSEPVWYRLVMNGDLAWRAECYASLEIGQTCVYACFNPLSGDVYFWSWWDGNAHSWRTSTEPPQHIFQSEGQAI